MDFRDFFRRAQDDDELGPYPHQTLIAERGLPELLAAPTGTGKTESVVLGWLYRRLYHDDPHVRAVTPRWLVIALPTRGLVEQTSDRVQQWIGNLGLADDVPVYTVMGGEGWDDRDWRRAPTSTAVFVGTVDMLLSRALNRGYADRRWNWPISFGLFNNGVQWVMDEIQLMEVATKTSRQLQSFREAFGTVLPTSTTWMSATIDPRLLETVDRPEIASSIDATELSPRPPELELRLNASKGVSEIPAPDDKKRHAAVLAEAALAAHTSRGGGLTLVVLNTVDRAIATWKAVKAAAPDGTEVVLLHRRFRPPERVGANTRALDEPARDRIVVSTQVLEAGIDIDAAVLVTEAAPWAALVQRAGRCNRGGLRDDAELLWIEPPAAPPYDESDVQASVDALRSLEGRSVTPLSMQEQGPPPRPVVLPVLRRRDLLQLFDTAPDLTGNDIDVSRYIRDGAERDVHVLWREVAAGDDGPDELPRREELCPAPIGDARKLVERAGERVWRLDHMDPKRRRWVRCLQGDLRPGLILAVDASVGGYDTETGWSQAAKKSVPPVELVGVGGFDQSDATVDDEPASTLSKWYALSEHLTDVRDATQALLEQIAPDMPPELCEACIAAGALHDIGKAHDIWQEAARQIAANEPPPPELAPFAKTGGSGRLRFGQPHFRHELASLLALFGEGGAALLDGIDEPDLVRYLVLSHHGRARLALRRLPDERPSGGDHGEDSTVVLGVLEGSSLDRVQTPLGVIEATQLSYELDGDDLVSAWTDRALALRDRADLGPFRLGFLEASIRLADWAASHAIEVEGT